MFPSTMPILDSLGGPTGLLNTGNWQVDLVADPAMTILAGGGAAGSVDGAGNVSYWTKPVAMLRSAFVTMAVLPVGTSFASTGFTNDLFTNSEMYATLSMATTKLSIITPGGNTASTAITGLANGDSIGMSYDPTSDIATAWYQRVGTPTWTSMATHAAGLASPAPSAWLPFIATGDGVQVRLRNFGAEQFPGADITAPVVHGHGAC